MMRFIPVLLLSCVCYFVYVQALECGIAEQMGEENIKNVMHKCMVTKSESGEKGDEATSESSESSEEQAQTYSASRGMLASRTRRSAFDADLNIRRRPYGAKAAYRRIVKREVNSTSDSEHGHGHEEEKDDQGSHHVSDTTMDSKCVLQCIFNELALVDANGYPEHHLMADALLKNAKGRELRDFIQDTTDECFQLMEQGEKLDSCDYSTHLISCLAEKGKSNCADWQLMKLPFHT